MKFSLEKYHRCGYNTFIHILAGTHRKGLTDMAARRSISQSGGKVRADSLSIPGITKGAVYLI